MHKVTFTLLSIVLLSSCERARDLPHRPPRKPYLGEVKHVHPPERCEERGKWSIGADFIYWRADEDGLEYVTKKHHIHKPGIAWDPGFKFGLGYTFHDFWGLFFKWTYLHTRQNGHQHGSLLPWWNDSKHVRKASAHWRLHYQTYDLNVARDYCVHPKLVVRPYTGLRGALIDQDYKVKYDAKHFKADNDFGGVGVRLGSELRWYMTRRFALKGDLSGSLLYGHFDVHERKPHLKQNLSRVAPNLEAFLGFQWERRPVTISLGYEFSEWFSQNQMTRHFDKVHGDLGLQGATLELLFEF